MKLLKDNLFIAGIIASYLKGTISPEEQGCLDRWLLEDEAHRALFDRIINQEHLAVALHEWLMTDTDNAWNAMQERIAIEASVSNSRIRRLPFSRWAAAAILVVALSVGIYWILGIQSDPAPLGANLITEDITPGGHRATLTLSDGRIIDLSSGQSGIVIGSGDLTYSDGSRVLQESFALGETQTMQLHTPRGGQYHMVLPDGSKVWLNAETTLTFTIEPNRRERMVHLEGEAYFEVARHEDWPFIVQSGSQAIQVLGTQFNVSAYANDGQIRTTLIEGAVQVTHDSSSDVIQLQPNEQATLANGHMYTQSVDVFSYIAWKEGLLVLNQEDMSALVRQIERWYDVEFDAITWPSGLRLEGQVPRDIPLSGILDVLTLNTGKEFRIEGRRIMVQE